MSPRFGKAGAPGRDEEENVQVYTPGSIPSSKRTRDVFGYLVILFVVAFLMLLLAFFMQERNNDAKIGALQDTLATFQSMDELLAENRSLREENQQLRAELEALKRQIGS